MIHKANKNIFEVRAFCWIVALGKSYTLENLQIRHPQSYFESNGAYCAPISLEDNDHLFLHLNFGLCAIGHLVSLESLGWRPRPWDIPSNEVFGFWS